MVVTSTRQKFGAKNKYAFGNDAFSDYEHFKITKTDIDNQVYANAHALLSEAFKFRRKIACCQTKIAEFYQTQSRAHDIISF
jgi:hypothetical protein